MFLFRPPPKEPTILPPSCHHLQPPRRLPFWVRCLFVTVIKLYIQQMEGMPAYHPTILPSYHQTGKATLLILLLVLVGVGWCWLVSVGVGWCRLCTCPPSPHHRGLPTEPPFADVGHYSTCVPVCQPHFANFHEQIFAYLLTRGGKCGILSASGTSERSQPPWSSLPSPSSRP